MLNELKVRKFINDKVEPFMNETLPDILARLDALEGELFDIVIPPPSFNFDDPGIEAWKQRTYGG